MDKTTEAIVLHTTRHNEKTRIVHLYTRDSGRQAAILYGNKKKNTTLSPLSLVEVTYSTKPNAMPIIKEVDLLKSIRVDSSSISNNFGRQAVATFVAEIIYRLEKHPLSDARLFDFFALTIDDIKSEHYENSHIKFLISYAEYIGIALDLGSDGATLDLHTAETNIAIPYHEDYLNSNELQILRELKEGNMAKISRKEKHLLLEKICKFYQLQIDDFYMPKSLAVLEQVFD